MSTLIVRHPAKMIKRNATHDLLFWVLKMLCVGQDSDIEYYNETDDM
jgi:hypothetical protein